MQRFHSDASLPMTRPTPRAELLLERLKGVHRSGAGWSARCPAHDDRTPSLSITEGQDGKALANCHAGCTTDAVVGAVGLTMADLFPEPAPRSGALRIVATYDYCDERGQLLYQVVRGEPKTFRQRQPDGAGGWRWDVQGVRHVLYRLPDLAGHARVAIVEGEKDADRLRALGLVATTNAGGAGKWRPEYTEQLRAAGVREVVVIPDHDEPGRRHADTVAQQGHAAGLTVRVLDVWAGDAGARPGADVSDWLDADPERDTTTLEDRMATTAVYVPTPKAGPMLDLDTLGPARGAQKPDPEPLTDLGNARRLIQRYGPVLRYVPQGRRWHLWDGRRWAPDEIHAVGGYAKETIRALYTEAAQRPDHESQELARHALRSESAGRLAAMVTLAQTEPGVAVTPNQLDPDPWLLTVENGTLDLRTGTLQPARREDLITKLAPVHYDPDATAPTWESFLTHIMGGDTEVIRFLQKAFGYALTGDTREHCVFVLYGTGANGKSTCLNAVRGVLGDYAKQTPAETLLVKREGTIPNDLARLPGARFVTAAETDDGKWLAEAQLKHLTGGEPIVARFLFGELFEFMPQFKLFLATNHKPVVRGTDHALWRRLRLIPFVVTIPDEVQDRDLGARLRTEAPGILRWLVEGCVAWRQGGLGVPDAVRQATAGYRAEMDVLAAFLAEACVEAPTGKVLVQHLYQAYAGWCAQSGERSMSKQKFGRALEERGFRPAKSGSQRFWQGLRLREEGEEREDRGGGT